MKLGLSLQWAILLPALGPTCGRGWLAGWHTCLLSSQTHRQTAGTNLPRIAAWPWDRGLASEMWVKENLQVLSWAWITNSIFHSLFPTRQLEGEGTQVLNKGTDQGWKELSSLSQHLGKNDRWGWWPDQGHTTGWKKPFPKLGAAGCRSWPSITHTAPPPIRLSEDFKLLTFLSSFQTSSTPHKKKIKHTLQCWNKHWFSYTYITYFFYSFQLSFITGCWT